MDLLKYVNTSESAMTHTPHTHTHTHTKYIKKNIKNCSDKSDHLCFKGWNVQKARFY